MAKYQTEHNDPTIAAILRQAGVSTHKSVTVVSTESYHVSDFVGRWDGGSRTLVSLVGCTQDDFHDVALGEHAAIVEHGTFCGKPDWCTVLVHPARYERIKPDTAEYPLSETQRGVLSAIASYNSKGRADWRERHAISKEQWQAIVASLIPLGLVRKGGSITAMGKNVARDAD